MPSAAGDAPDRGPSDHFLGLDLLRGVAALAVVIYHLCFRLGTTYFIGNARIAVDFFFVLSGFVLARAYRDRLANGSVSIGRFCVIRIVRLFPLVILGTSIAFLVEIGRPGIASQVTHVHDTLLALLFGCLLIPTLTPTTLEYVAFPLNGPVWSLFFELFANIAFAFCARLRLGHWMLVPVMVVSLALLSEGALRHGAIDGGIAPYSFWLGFPRIAWSFAAGLLLYRWRHLAPRMPLALPTVILIALMLAPPLGAWGVAYNIACVAVLLPAIVFVASTAKLGPVGARIAKISGDLSYPIYAIHYPIVRGAAFALTKLHPPLAGRMIGMVAIAAAIAVACFPVYIFYDRPVRQWLTRELKARRALRSAA